jgi:hypothetical protein
MALTLEIQLTSDKRLLLVERFVPDTNFWIHPSGKRCSRVPKEWEIELLTKAYEAVDNYNREQMFRNNIKP